MSTAYEYLTSPDKSIPLPQLIVVDDFDPALRVGTEYDTTYEFTDIDGVTIRGVSFFDVSSESPDRPSIRSRIANYIDRVAQHPEWKGPDVIVDEKGERRLAHNNPVSKEMYEAMPAMASWREELVPGAVALYPLQCPEERYLPNGVEIDDLTKSMFVNSLDAIGIRARAKVMSHLASNYINENGVTNWTSLACGAAVPVLNAIQDNMDRIQHIDLKLVDFDPSALDFAKELALHRGLDEEKDFEVVNRNLLKDLIVTDRLVGEFGEGSMNLVDALGIFEYFDERRSAQFLSNAYKLVKPGGALVAANMLDTHPEILFNQRVIGWPTIYPRSIEDLKGIIEKAGIDLKNVSMTIPDDDIYAIFEVKK